MAYLITESNGGFLIGKIKQIQGRVFAKLLSQHGIDQFNGAQGRILFVLWARDSIPICELAEKTGLAKTSLTSMLDRLETSGLVERVFDAQDRRKINVRLTQKTRNMKAQYDELSAQMNTIFYQGFTDEEIVQFEDGLSRVLGNLSAQGSAACRKE